MLTTVIISVWFAGFAMLIWLRIISAMDKGVLSWPFVPIEHLIGKEYNRNVQFVVGLMVWLLLGVVIGVIYWLFVENSWLTYYDAGSVAILTWILASVTQFVIFPITKCGIGAWRLSAWAWLESLLGWLVFGYIFFILIRIS